MSESFKQENRYFFLFAKGYLSCIKETATTCSHSLKAF
jgi:hypothetical protein